MKKLSAVIMACFLCLSTCAVLSPIVHGLTTVMPTRLPQGIQAAASVWDGTNAYMFGGASHTAGLLNSILKYNPSTGSISSMSAVLSDPVCDFPAVWAGQYAYIFGGYMAQGVTSDKISRYDPLTDTIALMGARLPGYPPFAIYSMSAIWDGHNAYLFGDDRMSDSILKYDPVNDQITVMSARLPTGTKWMPAVWSGTYAYIFGGRTPYGASDQIVRYDPAHDSTTVMSAKLPVGIYVSSAVWAGSCAYVFGGSDINNQMYDSILKYDPTSDSITTVDNLPTPRRFTCAVWDGSSAYIFGGEDSNSNDLDEIVKFTSVHAPTKWAVVLGVNEYINPEDNGKEGPVNSANDMYDLLVNKFSFPAANVHLKTDAIGNSADNIGKVDIINELTWLIERVLPGDTAVFYYAGHGDQISTGTEFLVPHDSNLISDAEFAGYVNKIKTEKLLVILDMSYSGGFITDGQNAEQGLNGAFASFTDLAESKPSGRIVLTACAQNISYPLLRGRFHFDFPKARDAKEWLFGSLKNPRYEMAFTHYLVEGFKGKADLNSDGKVTVEEAFNYAKPLVNTYKTYGIPWPGLLGVLSGQTPMMYDGYPAYGSSGYLYLGQ